MKKTLFLVFYLIFGLLYIPESYAQSPGKFTLSADHVSFRDVFDSIKKQTGYTVFYDSRTINDQEKIKVGFVQADLKSVLNTLFQGRFIEWVINDKLIVLKKSSVSPGPVTTEKTHTQVTGVITGDDDHLPLPGVTVRLKGGTNATVTDVNGAFTITAAVGQVLSFSYIGFQTREVVAEQLMNVELHKNSSKLNEVVVVGYGTQRKALVSGSVASITSADLEHQTGKNILDDMAAQLPGVSVQDGTGRPGEQPVLPDGARLGRCGVGPSGRTSCGGRTRSQSPGLHGADDG